jgi:predicted DNA-binding protein
MHMTEDLLRRLRKIAKRDGLTVAEIIRRAIVDYLNKKGD